MFDGRNRILLRRQAVVDCQPVLLPGLLRLEYRRPIGIRIAAAPGPEGWSNIGVRLRHDEIVEAALVVAGPLTDEIPVGQAERAPFNSLAVVL